MSNHYKMFTNTIFAFEGLPASLSELVKAGEFETLFCVLDNLRVVKTDQQVCNTEREIKEFVRASIKTDFREKYLECMPKIIKALVEANDYNALNLIQQSPKMYGELPQEAMEILDKYASYRDDAKKIFTERVADGKTEDFSEDKGEYVVKFEHGVLAFVLNDGVSYRVFRFDSY